MSPDRDQLVKGVFQEASDRFGTERERYLVDRCHGDQELRAAVERLLRADEAVESGFLEGASLRPKTAGMPAQIGPFRILRQIGEGGMGSVFEAEQTHPRRKVALKIVRQAAMSEALVQRFEYEVQVLAQLKHPGIAQIYEAGTHDDGTCKVPYFAMEYIEGQPLIDFIKEHKLGVRQRLKLMVAICDAVHHAHQKGVVHRDLKPANILVESSGDVVHQPKVLDFGVARAVHSDVRLVTMHTEVGQLVGTLAYMSPEQVAGRADELDIRSDVYALGVILYEMLADRLPYELHNRSIPEAATVIREQDPTRLSSIDGSLRGEIETITAKALAKERERRYQSAAEFAEDIRRFLADEPITARPATRAYQLKKFAKRNKGLVGGVAVAFIALLAGIASVSIALVRATHAQRAAARAASQAEGVSKFLQDMLAGIDPEEIGPGALTVRQMLDHAAARLERELTDQPAVAASLHHTLGRHYSSLGLYLDADRHLQRAVELRRYLAAGDSRELADALTSLAANLQDKRDLTEAEVPMREALDMRRRLFGPASPEVADSLHGMAYVLIEQERPQEAEPLVREALDINGRLGREEQGAVATSTLGGCLMALGRLDQAQAVMQDATDMVRRLPGDNELALAGRLTFLSSILRAQGMHAEEEAALREAIAIRSRRLAADHPALGWNLYCLAQVLRKRARYEEAERIGRQALDLLIKKRGPQDVDVADCQQLLAQIYEDQGRFSEAEPWWSACVAIRQKLLPGQHPDLTFAESALAKNKVSQAGAIRNTHDAQQP